MGMHQQEWEKLVVWEQQSALNLDKQSGILLLEAQKLLE